MNMREWFEREKYVALHAQSWKFRTVKYCVIFGLEYAAYAWNGWTGAITLFLWMFVIALAMHFIFRWKTKAWTQSWGPYKKMELPK